MSIRFRRNFTGLAEPHRQRKNNRQLARKGSVALVALADGSTGVALLMSGTIIKSFTRATALHLADALVDAVEFIDLTEAGRHEPAATTTTTFKETA